MLDTWWLCLTQGEIIWDHFGDPQIDLKVKDDLDMMEDDLDRMEDDLDRMEDSQNSSIPLY